MTSGLLAVALGIGVAAADDLPERDPTWWVGLPISTVTLVADEGELPQESLEPLLSAHQDLPLGPDMIRADLATLFRVGNFASVEADVVRWPYVRPDGEMTDGALLTYRVRPPPRVSNLRVQGLGSSLGRRARNAFEDAIEVVEGDVFYPPLDGPLLSHRLRDALIGAGFPDARVEVDPQADGPGQVEVWVRVDPGRAQILRSIGINVDHPERIRERRLLRLARKAGLQKGQPVPDGVAAQVQHALRRDLARLRTPWFQNSTKNPIGGFVEAHVDPVLTVALDGTITARIDVALGPQLVVGLTGLGGFRPRVRVMQAMGIDERLRLTRGFVEQSKLKLVDWLQLRGYYEARADVALFDDPDRRTLQVDLQTGRAHRVTHLDFRGNENISDATLRIVARQASPDVLKRGHLADSEVNDIVYALREYFRAHGYQGAKVALDPIRIGLPDVLDPELRSSNNIARLRSALGTVPLGVRFTVEEGGLTTLASLRYAGLLDEVALPFLAGAQALVGEPYSPQQLQLIGRQISDAYKAAGYLDVDVRVSGHGDQQGRVEAIITVRPGPKVLLRSVSTRGTRHVQPAWLRRVVDLHVGDTVTTDLLEEVRSRINEVGTFSSLDVQLLGDDVARDLVITVRERRPFTAEVGAGVATDQGLRGFGRFTWNQLDNWKYLLPPGRLDLYAQAGLEWRDDSLVTPPDFRNPEWRAVVTYTAPHFPLRFQTVETELILREEVQERSWRLAKFGGGLSVDNRIGPRTNLRVGIRFEGRRLEEVDPGGILTGEPWAAYLDVDDPTLPTAWRLHDELTTLFVHDHRDDRITPTKGWLISTGAGLVTGFLTQKIDGSVTYASLEARIGAWIPAGPLILHFSGEGAHQRVIGKGAVPLEERYRLGGTASLRGYRRDAVGPHNLVGPLDVDWPDALGPLLDQAHRDNDSRWVATGGDTKGVDVSELIVPFPALGLPSWDDWALAAFADVGNVWLLNPGSEASSESAQWRAVFNPPVRVSAGIGGRLNTQVGPLQVDVAFNPQALAVRGAAKALVRDGWDEPTWRVHLSLGTLF